MLVFDLTLSNVTLRGECVVNLRQFNTRFEGEGEGGEGGGTGRCLLLRINFFFSRWIIWSDAYVQGKQLRRLNQISILIDCPSAMIYHRRPLFERINVWRFLLEVIFVSKGTSVRR